MRPSLFALTGLTLAALFGLPLDHLSKPVLWGVILALGVGVTLGASAFVEKLLPTVFVLGAFTLTWPWMSAAAQSFVTETTGVRSPRLLVAVLVALAAILWLGVQVVLALAKHKPEGSASRPPSIRQRAALFLPAPFERLLPKAPKPPKDEDELGIFRKVPDGR